MAVALWLAATCTVPLTAEESNPYLTIASRNPFGLKEPPPPPPIDTPVETAPPAPAQTIKLTGITSLFDKHKALLEVTEPTGGAAPRKLVLSEGERDGDLEVVSIDFVKDIVVVKTSKGTTNVTFSTVEQAAAAPAVPRVPSRGGRPDPRSRRSPGITATPGVIPTVPTTGSPTIIGRGGRDRGGSGVTLLGSDGGGGAPAQQTYTTGAGSYNAAATAANRLRNIPSRPVRTQQPGVVDPGQQQTDVPQQPALSPEQLRMWIEANKMVTPNLPWPNAGPPVPGGGEEGE